MNIPEYLHKDLKTCVESGQHLTACDKDGYCKSCGHQENPLEPYTQYVLIDENGNPARHCHQDDMEDDVVSNTIEGLLDAAGEWSDFGAGSFAKELKPGGDYEKYQILREEITRHELTPEEIAEVKD